MVATFTPGPHTLDSIFPDQDGFKIVKEGRNPRLLAIVKNQGSAPVYEAQGNASLYASATAMYEALQAAEVMLRALLVSIPCTVSTNDSGKFRNVNSFGVLKEVQEALAKATGKQAQL